MQNTKQAITEYPVHEIISNRWSTRSYDNKKTVSKAELNSVFEAARWAPSAFNEQPWNFIYSSKENSTGYNQLFSCLNEANQRWAINAPVLLLSYVKKTVSLNGNTNKNALHDLGLAIQNMSLQATSMGMQLHIMGGFDFELAKSVFGISDDYLVATMMALGFPGNPDELPEDVKKRELSPRIRKPISEFVKELI